MEIIKKRISNKAQSGFKSLIISLALVGLFVFAIISMGISFGYSNNADVNLVDDESISSLNNTLNTKLTSYDEDINSSLSTFSQSQPQTSGESLQILSIGNIWKTLIIIPRDVFKASLGLVYDKGFGSEYIVVFIIIGALLGAVILMYAWKLIRTGSPD